MAIIRIPAIIRRAFDVVETIASAVALTAGEVIRQRGALVALSAVSSAFGAAVLGAYLLDNREALIAAASLILGVPLAFEVGRAYLARRDAAPDVAAMSARVGALAGARADLDRREAEVAAREREVSERVAMLLAAEATLAAREHSRRAKTPPRGARRPAGLPLPLAPVRADDVLGKDRR